MTLFLTVKRLELSLLSIVLENDCMMLILSCTKFPELGKESSSQYDFVSSFYYVYRTEILAGTKYEQLPISVALKREMKIETIGNNLFFDCLEYLCF